MYAGMLELLLVAPVPEALEVVDGISTV